MLRSKNSIKKLGNKTHNWGTYEEGSERMLLIAGNPTVRTDVPGVCTHGDIIRNGCKIRRELGE